LGEVVGREPELAVLQRFLDSIPSAPSALLLSGDPGIGKTTVWKEGLADALLRDYRILSCGPIEAETRLSYAALGDLLEPILEEALPSLPEPQRLALEVALLRSPSSGARADQRAVSLAVLGCLRSVASISPVRRATNAVLPDLVAAISTLPRRPVVDKAGRRSSSDLGPCRGPATATTGSAARARPWR